MLIPGFLLPHTVVVEPYAGSGAYGDVYDARVTVRGYVEDTRRLVRNERGDEVVSETSVYARPEVHIPLGSRVTVWTGTSRQRTATVIARSQFDHPAVPSHCVLALT